MTSAPSLTCVGYVFRWQIGLTFSVLFNQVGLWLATANSMWPRLQATWRRSRAWRRRLDASNSPREASAPALQPASPRRPNAVFAWHFHKTPAPFLRLDMASRPPAPKRLSAVGDAAPPRHRTPPTAPRDCPPKRIAVRLRASDRRVLSFLAWI